MTGWSGLELRIDVPCAASPSWRRAIKMDAEVSWSIGDVKARLCEEPGINLPFVLKLTDVHLVGAGLLEQDDVDVDDIVGNAMWLQVIPEDVPSLTARRWSATSCGCSLLSKPPWSSRRKNVRKRRRRKRRRKQWSMETRRPEGLTAVYFGGLDFNVQACCNAMNQLRSGCISCLQAY